MMESCLSLKPERAESVVVEDLKKDLLADFSAIPSGVTEKEHLQVYLRVRPFTSAELDSGESQECVKIELPDTVLYKAPRPSLSARLSDKSVSQTAQRFQFSQVFGPETTQKEIFDGTVKGLVKNVLEGGNTLVFTYGVTNAGKTFTFLGSDSDGGILPRSLNLIFSSIEERIYTQMNIKPHRCREFTRLTKDQQDEETANKRNIMRFFKESECQKSMTSQQSTCRATLLEGSTTSNTGVFAEENSFSLDVDSHTKFSVWVSFCEIYNENIHDLLEPVSGSSMKRSMLRLSQDVKGNSFVKDLKWIQVNDADEAYRVLKLGKKNQSFSCTKLNNLSSRSHCIFSIRLIRIEDVGIPRVHTISELSLCDLAGSERCGKTHNKGDRLKEAGNINTSLLILGKCINALRRNQQSKFQQHVPFRESKLTQYLQGFFCGRGKTCMIVNVNQCASMFDETLNVLKFSAVAQKVVVLNTKPLPVVPKKSVREVSFIIDSADQRNLWAKRKSSLVGWERSLEDVQEDDDDGGGGDEDDDAGGDEESYAESMMEDTIQEADETEIERETYSKLVSLTQELQAKLCKAESEKLTLEICIREEVTKEFMELFSNMEKDYNERLLKEKEIIEERAEKRMEIWKTLVNRIAGEESKEDKLVSMDEIIETMQDDLAKIKRDAEAAHVCLSLPDPSSTVASLEKRLADLSEELLKTQELLTFKSNETQQTCDQLDETKRNLEAKTLKFQELMEICQEKDDMITKLQTAMDQHVETITNGRIFIDDIKEEMLQLQKNCRCLNREGESSQKEGKKRSGNFPTDLDGEPPLKKALEEDRCVSPTHTDKLQTECDQKDVELMQLREKCKGLQERMESAEADFLNAITLKDEQMDQLKESQLLLEGKVEKLVKDLLEQTCACETAKASLCVEQKEKDRLAEEHEALGKEKDGWQQESKNMAKKIDALQQELDEEKRRVETVTEELKAAKVLLVERNNDSWEKAKTIESLTKETDALKKQLEEQGALSSSGNCDHFHETMAALQQECGKVVKESAQKTQQIDDLERDINSLRKQASEQEQITGQLNEDLVDLRKAQGDLAELEAERKAAAEMKRSHAELEVRVAALEGQVAELEEQVKVAGANASKTADLEKQLLEKETQMVALRATLSELQEKLAAVESECLQEARRKEAERRRDLLKAAEDAIAEKDAELARRAEELSRIKEEMISSSDKVKSLMLELQRKEDDDLKEKLADSKKQIQQVQKEIEYLREEQTSLKRKLNESEKAKSQLLTNLSSKDTLIQQLKSEQASDARSKEDLQRYQKSCDDLRAKEQIIENMRLALKEQEDTQEEQDRVLEAQLEEIDSLNEQLQKLKENVPPERNEGGESGNSEESSLSQFLAAKQEIDQLKETLELTKEKLQADRKTWHEEKIILIGHAKEAEEKRIQEMKKFAEDRERYAKMQTAMEKLSRQLSDKDADLAKWRKERDSLVTALEVQLTKLAAINTKKDEQITELLKKCSLLPQETNDKIESLQHILSVKESEIAALREQLTVVSNNGQETSPVSKRRGELRKSTGKNEPPVSSNTRQNIRSCQASEEQEASVLDSSEISTESGRTSRFPKPELEIQFTPLQPNKLNLRRQGGDSVTVKITRAARKRKSTEMDKDVVDSENKKNNMRITRMNKDYEKSLSIPKKSPAAFSRNTHTKRDESQSTLRNRKDGALQKIGDFLQSSPNLLGSKAKKIMELVQSKSPEPEGDSTIGLKPKKSKRKLYKTEISSPLDIPSNPIILPDEEKESDHIIIKRRLRTRTGKKY
ncbi:kinesin-like protein KIF20B isoform X1 [Paramormyrops kingsleyae]|uniref:kinesin-like protein KIF20B isoform X1 n=1 Tax=Paramormyrops kingsleyae TaxID=1676925 RepID=UPI000CD5FD3D|nr:kinesin-like protein KIF20B isoform X1 [Paramormyrops kingsleyae]